MLHQWFLGLYWEHIIPAMVHHYTQVLQRPDLIWLSLFWTSLRLRDFNILDILNIQCILLVYTLIYVVYTSYMS
jgi:hypothetical protein